jgi:hypothetical protein
LENAAKDKKSVDLPALEACGTTVKMALPKLAPLENIKPAFSGRCAGLI